MMQSGMGYICKKCEDTFLVGYEDMETRTLTCKKCATDNKAKLKEKVW